MPLSRGCRLHSWHFARSDLPTAKAAAPHISSRLRVEEEEVFSPSLPDTEQDRRNEIHKDSKSDRREEELANESESEKKIRRSQIKKETSAQRQKERTTSKQRTRKLH